jgi:hypothetical protein
MKKEITYSKEDMMDIAGWMAAADCKRPIPELKEEAEEYIKRMDIAKSVSATPVKETEPAPTNGDELDDFIQEIKNEFRDENWDYLTFVAERVRRKRVTPTPTSKEGLEELLKSIYHEIDIDCITETNHVTMDTVRSVLVKHGAVEADLW